MILGVISDTHGLLRAEALDALQASEFIIHAGDIGSEEIIPALEKIAPVAAIRGNIDTSEWALKYPADDVVEIENRFVYIIHDVNDMNIDPKAADFDLVISGHSHNPKIEEKNGVVYLNPGSAGPKRFKLPTTIAMVDITQVKIDPHIHDLNL